MELYEYKRINSNSRGDHMIAMTLGAIFLTTAVYRRSPYVFAKPICLYNHSNMWRSHHRVRSPLSKLSACAPPCAPPLCWCCAGVHHRVLVNRCNSAGRAAGVAAAGEKTLDKSNTRQVCTCQEEQHSATQVQTSSRLG